MATKRKSARRRSPVRVSMRGTSTRRKAAVKRRRTAAPARRRKSTSVARRRANPSRRRRSPVARRRKSSVARRRRNPSLNWQRIGLQTGGLLAGAAVMHYAGTQIEDLINKIPGVVGNNKLKGVALIAAGGGIIALGDYLASMPQIARGALGTVVPTAALAIAAMLVKDGYDVAMMSGTHRMRGTIVRSPMIASQVMRGTARLGPGMRGSLETYGAPQASLQQMQGTYAAQCI